MIDGELLEGLIIGFIFGRTNEDYLPLQGEGEWDLRLEGEWEAKGSVVGLGIGWEL